MKWPPSSLHPLIEYLEPHHGRLDSFEDWTPVLQDSVTRYLSYEISNEFFTVFLEKLELDTPGRSRAAQVDFVISHTQFWDVQWADRMVVLDAAPDLRSLIRLMGSRHFDYQVVGDWLQRNAPYGARAALFRQFDPDENPPAEDDTDWWMYDYDEWLRARVGGRRKLLQAWESITHPESLAMSRKTDVHAIRVWARQHGRQVSDRGRISGALIREYLAEQQG